jgi:glycosyltransferase involved in cell wall biosynthesis
MHSLATITDTVTTTTSRRHGESVKIVHLTDCYLPRLGGIEMQVRDLAARQSAAGHEVHVVTTTPAKVHERSGGSGHGASEHSRAGHGAGGPAGVVVHRFAVDLPYELPVNPRVLPALRRFFDSGEFDVAHVHAGVVSPFAFAAAPTAAKAGVPTVVTLHCLWGYLTPAFRLLDGRGHWSRWPVVLSAVSDVAAVPLRRIVGSDVDVEVLPNGIDPDDWRVEPQARDSDDVVIVAVMRLAPRKRPMQLLRTLREARELVPSRIRMRAKLIGEGPERRSLERYLRRTRMNDWVELTGRLSREQIRDTYRRADVFVAPANLESFGIAALEARCAGVPVLAKANSGIREFVADAQEGLLAATDAQMVGGLVRLCRSPELRQQIAEHNRTVPPPTTWTDVLARTDKAYARAAELISFRTLNA